MQENLFSKVPHIHTGPPKEVILKCCKVSFEEHLSDEYFERIFIGFVLKYITEYKRNLMRLNIWKFLNNLY